jgi:hypothetical protein
MIVSAGIMGLLGLVHLVLTFWGPHHLPRDRSLVDAMASTAPEITSRTTIWNMWMGFNTSHAIGLMLFGLMYGYLALAHAELLFQSIFLQGLGLAMLAGYVVLARLYCFSAPLLGVSVSLLLLIASLAMSWAT